MSNAAAAAAAAAPPPPPLQALLADALLEFLEAAVHTVLHARGLYPPELFERRRLYGSCLCPRARHPGVCAYVASALAALRGPLLRGSLQEVAVVVVREQGAGCAGWASASDGGTGAGGRALEKVSFVLHRAAATATTTARGGAAATTEAAAAAVQLPDAAALEAAFAAALVKLQYLPQAPPLLMQGGAGGGGGGGGGGAGAGGGATPPPAARPLPRGATFEIVGLATSRDGVDRAVLMEEDVLDDGASLLLPLGSPGAQHLAGYPLKTIRLDGGGNSGGNGAPSSSAALTILVEAPLSRDLATQ